MACNQTLGCLRLYGDSRVSRAQPRINAYELLAVIFFSRHNRFAETHSYLQLSYQITDRLLAACNNQKKREQKSTFPFYSYSSKYGLFFFKSDEMAHYTALYTDVVNETFEQMHPSYKKFHHLAKSHQQF